MSLQTAMVFVWLGVAILALVIEFMTNDLSSIWAAAGAVVTMIVAIFCDIIWLQILLFIVLTLIGLLLVRRYVKRYVRRNEIKTNSDAIVGKTAVVTQDVSFGSVGAVFVDGKEWSAIAQNSEESISKGTKVEILAIEGVKLIIKVKGE